MKYSKRLQRKHNSFRRPLHGFTLVELLVVIAIISILASILLPVLQDVQSSAKIAVCQSRQKQIGLAFEIYRMDYNRYFPCAYSGHNDNWMSQILPMMGDKSTFDPWNTPKIFRCPEGDDVKTIGYRMNTQWLGGGAYVGFARDGYDDLGYDYYSQHHWPEMELLSRCSDSGRPLSKTVMIFASGGYSSWTGSYMHYYGGPAHPEGSNVLAIDGSVEFWQVYAPGNLHLDYGLARTYWQENYPDYLLRWYAPGYYYHAP